MTDHPILSTFGLFAVCILGWVAGRAVLSCLDQIRINRDANDTQRK